MLPELDLQITELKELSGHFYGMNLLTNIMRVRLQGSASDIVRFYPILRVQLVTARSILDDHQYCRDKWSEKQYHEHLASTDNEKLFTITVVIKSFLFFIRSYQDNLAGGLLLVNGDKSGPYTSMNNCLKPKKNGEKKDLRIKLESAIPGYYEWFNDFREKRDHAKLGFSNHIVAKGQDIGIGFLNVNYKNDILIAGNDNILTMSDLVVALQYSIKCTRVLLDKC